MISPLFLGGAFGHQSDSVGDYRIEIDWKNKPIVTVAGMKQSGSHPGVEEPIAFSTVAFMLCSANAPGAAVIPIETIAKRTNKELTVLLFIR